MFASHRCSYAIHVHKYGKSNQPIRYMIITHIVLMWVAEWEHHPLSFQMRNTVINVPPRCQWKSHIKEEAENYALCLEFKKKKEFPAATLHASVMTALRVENHIKVGVTFERPIIKIQRTLAYFGYCRYIHINEWLTLCCVNGI